MVVVPVNVGRGRAFSGIACFHRTLDVYVVVGGVSGMVVVLVSVGETGSYGPAVPSTPVLGSGGAWPVAPPDGVAVSVAGGWVMSGGAFW